MQQHRQPARKVASHAKNAHVAMRVNAARVLTAQTVPSKVSARNAPCVTCKKPRRPLLKNPAVLTLQPPRQKRQPLHRSKRLLHRWLWRHPCHRLPKHQQHLPLLCQHPLRQRQSLCPPWSRLSQHQHPW